GSRPNIRLEIDSVQAILDLVADGTGYAILTEHAVLTSAPPARYHIRPITQPELYSRLYLATAAGRITTLTQKAMLELIRTTVRRVYPPAMTLPACPASGRPRAAPYGGMVGRGPPPRRAIGTRPRMMSIARLGDQPVRVGLPAVRSLDVGKQAPGRQTSDPVLLLGGGGGHPGLEPGFAHGIGHLAHFLGAAATVLHDAAVEIA